MCGRRADSQPRLRAIRGDGLDQVVVHLHHDQRVGVQEDARALRQRVGRVSRNPGSDPRRLSEPAGRARLREIDGQVGPPETRPALASALGVELARRLSLLARRLVEDHVVDDSRALRPDQRAGHEYVVRELRIEHETVVVVDPAAGCAGEVRLGRREPDRTAGAVEPGAGRRSRPQVGRVSGRRSGCRPSGECRELVRGEAAEVATAKRCRVGPGHPRRHHSCPRHADDGVRVRFGGGFGRERERCDPAEAVAGRALRVEDRCDVAVVRGRGCRPPTAHGERRAEQRSRGREDDGDPHPGTVRAHRSP